MGNCPHVSYATIDLLDDFFYGWAKFRWDSASEHRDAHGNRREMLTYTIVKLTRDSPALLVL